jgi:hypothetical protein
MRGESVYRPPDEEDSTMPTTGPRWLILTANPSQNWFYKEVVHPYLTWRDKGVLLDKLIVDPESGRPIIDLFEGSTYTNQANLSKDYIRSLEAAYKGQMRERYLLGKWAAFEGLVHPGFEIGKHTLTREQALAHLDRCLYRHVAVQAIEGFDFGLVSPSCYMLGFVDDLGRVVILDGYYIKEFSYDQQPKAIRDLRSRYSDRLRFNSPIHADPAIFRKQVVTGRTAGESVARLLTGLGLHLRPATADVLPGIAKVNAYLSGTIDTPHILKTESVDGANPLLYIVDDLTWFQDEILSYYWKKNPQGTHVDTPVDNNDHAMDTLKYMLSFLPDPADIVIPKKKVPPGFMFWREFDEDRQVSV